MRARAGRPRRASKALTKNGQVVFELGGSVHHEPRATNSIYHRNQGACGKFPVTRSELVGCLEASRERGG